MKDHPGCAEYQKQAIYFMPRPPDSVSRASCAIKTRVYRLVIRALWGSGYSEETTQDVYLRGIASGVRIRLRQGLAAGESGAGMMIGQAASVSKMVVVFPGQGV